MNARIVKSLAAAVGALVALVASAHAAVTFQPKQDSASTSPFALASADFNGDGRLDVATSSDASASFSVLLGNGDGTLQAPRNTPAPSGVFGIAAADFNGDSRPDVALIRLTPSELHVFLGNGDGTFGPGASDPVGSSPQDLDVGRLDGDTDLDIAVASQTGDNVSILLNDGSGGFAPAAPPAVAHPLPGNPDGVTIADFDGDAKNDLAIGTTGGGALAFARGLGTGAFDAPVGLGTDAQRVAAGDVNNDGRVDIVASRTTSGTVAIVLREASGFAAATTFDPVPGTTNAIAQLAVADLDGDTLLDLAVPQINGPEAARVSVAIGRGNGQFDLSAHEAADAEPREVVTGDFNGDGNLDLATANSGSDDVSVLLAVPPGVGFPTSIEFGQQRAGTTSAERVATVTNSGQPQLRPGAVTLVGPNAAQFAVSSNSCTGARIAPGGSCGLGVTYTPNGGGAHNATLMIASNGAGAPHAVSLAGIGDDTRCQGASANAVRGTASRNRLTGTALADAIVGLGGNDVLRGLAGNDCLSGGRGRDRLSGGAGRDRLSGGPGNDRLGGGSGRNSYDAGPGNDRITARNRKRETVRCGRGRDTALVDRRDRVRGCERVTRR